MSPRNQKLNPLVNGRLAAYATLAGATLAAPGVAKATIVYSGIVNINIPSTTSGVYINVVTGVTSTTPSGAPGWDLNPWSSTGLNIWANNSASSNSGVISNLTGGSSSTLSDNCPCHTVIDNSWIYGRTNGIETTGPTAFLLNSDDNYIGFRFLNESTGQYDFGWAHISLSTSYAAQPRMVIEYAYQDSGAPIRVGPLDCVPEPSMTALLATMAVGALGVRLWRKRKAA